LAEVTRNKASEVQFIHESVRDFLLGKYNSQWSGISGNFVGHGHEMLRNCCLAQLNAPISQGVNIPDPLPLAAEAAELRETINLKFPFLKYSVLNVLRHANGAQQNAIEQGDFLAKFPLQRWIFLNNTLERHNIRRYTESVSILYILAEKNLADLIRIHPQRESCFDIEIERYGLPIFAGLATGSHEAVQAFLEVQAETLPQEPLLHHLCKQYSENRNNHTNFGRDFTFSRRKSVFTHIIEQGDEEIFTFLCVLGKFDVESKGGSSGRTPLSWAASMGNKALVKLLLEKGAELDSKSSNGQTPLSWAAANGHEAVVKLLLEKGAELEAKSNSGLTPLSWVAANGHKAVVKLLLEKGAELEAKSNSGLTPLSRAAANGHKAVVKLLLEKGADLEVKSDNGWTPLLWAAANGHEAVVKLLLEKGAELEAKSNSGLTPLLWAERKGHGAVVKLLESKTAIKLDTSN
jgi:ankyrin repeat protein